MPHVLIILDCCYAANAARDTAEGTTKELLAACGRENPTPGVCERSFTSALVEEMQAFGNRPFTVAMLHSRLITMRWRLAFTPVYALLSEHGGYSITLSPLCKAGDIPSSIIEPFSGLASELDGKAITNLNGPSSAIEELASSDTSASPRQEVETRVLLSVSVTQAAELELPQWKTWLTTAVPWNITKVDVNIHSIFKSHSTLVLVSIPISTWDMLRSRAAYRFIGFIRSNNLLDRCEVTDTATRFTSSWSDPTRTDGKASKGLESMSQASTSSVGAMNVSSKDYPKIKLASPPRIIPDQHYSASWSVENDERLMSARRQGLNWQPIASQYFPNKTANACRKRHERLMEKRNAASSWESIKSDALAKAYVELREQIWQMLAHRIGEKWQTVEAKVCIYVQRLRTSLLIYPFSVWRQDLRLFK